jgi:hypothetical protein
MLWSDVFLVGFDFVEEGIFHGGELKLVIFSCIVTCTEGDKYCVSSVLDGVKAMKL